MEDRTERIEAWWDALSPEARGQVTESVETGILHPESLISLAHARILVASHAMFLPSDKAWTFPVPADVAAVVMRMQEDDTT